MAKQQKTTEDPVTAVLARLKLKAGKASTVRRLADGLSSDIVDVLPTGIDVLDHHVIRVGGWPVGRIVELYAAEGVGKSSLLYQSIAGAQRAGGIAALYETERAIEAARPGVFGVDLDRLIGDQPDTMEGVLAMLEHTLDALPKSVTGDPATLLGWDSLGATPTAGEVKQGLTGKQAVADRARVMSLAMRVLTRKVSDKRAVLIVVNHAKDQIGGWGGGSVTPGGKALKFHASIRLELFNGKSIKNALGIHVGKQVTALATKTKVGGAPYAKAKMRLFYDSGWSNPWATVWHAKDMGLVDKAAKYTEQTYVEALTALGWARGFAAGACPEDDDEAPDVEEEDGSGMAAFADA